jgi:hypothetical protein
MAQMKELKYGEKTEAEVEYWEKWNKNDKVNRSKGLDRVVITREF